MNSKPIPHDANADRTNLLLNWTVRYGSERLIFNCQAEKITHAIEQCENAYPCDNIVSASLDALLNGMDCVVVALPEHLQSGPWYIIVNKETGEQTPDLMIGDLAYYTSIEDAQEALAFNIAQYALEAATAGQQSQDSPAQSDNEAKRARITAAGYTIQNNGNLAELGILDAGERAAIGTEAASLPVEEPFLPQTLGELINSMPLWRSVEWGQEVLSMSADSNCGKDCADVLTKGHALALLCRDVDTALMTAVVSQVNIFVFG